MPVPDERLLLIGTYTERLPHVDGKGAGMHLIRFDESTGQFGPGSVTGGYRNPTYLATSPRGDRLYCVCEIEAHEGASVETFSLDAKTMSLTHLGSVLSQGGHPCHVSVNTDATHLYVSNYGTGSCAVYDLDDEGLPHLQTTLQRSGSGPRTDRQAEPHAHCAIASPDGRHLYLCDLGTDVIARHPIEVGLVATHPDRELATAPGAGPRHIEFSPSGRSLLGLHELSSTLSLYRLEGDDAVEVASIGTLPEGWFEPNTTAAVHVHPSGRFVYASNRGHDSIFGVKLDEEADTLSPIGHVAAGGRTPRDFAITPNGRYLLAASQNDHLINVFRIDPDLGTLAFTGTRLQVSSPVCLCFVPSN